jgi:hypothetical protein
VADGPIQARTSFLITAKPSSNDKVPLICKLYTKRQMILLLPVAEFVPADASVAAFEGTILATEGGAQTRVLIAAILLEEKEREVEIELKSV